MTHRPDDDAARDAHLLAALRHAPDRDAAPPPEVSARILAAARDAIRPAVRPSWAQRLAAWWRRPSFAAAFGTLAAAALLGILWSTREPPVAVPGAAPPAPFEAASNAAAAPDAASTPASEAATASNDLAREASRDRPRESPAPAPSVRVPAPKPADADRPRPPTAPTPGAPARAEQRRDSAPADRAEEATAAAPPQPRPAPAAAPPTPAMAPAAEASSPAAASQRADAPGDAAAPRQRSSDLANPRLLERRGGANAASTPAPRAGLAAQAESATADPLVRIDALLDGRAAWQVADRARPALAHGPAQRAWWLGLRAATQGRWQRVEPPPGQPPVPWLRLSVDGRGPALWWFDDDGLVLSDTDGRAWRTPIAPAQREAWIAEVARW